MARRGIDASIRRLERVATATGERIVVTYVMDELRDRGIHGKEMRSSMGVPAILAEGIGASVSFQPLGGWVFRGDKRRRTMVGKVKYDARKASASELRRVARDIVDMMQGSGGSRVAAKAGKRKVVREIVEFLEDLYGDRMGSLGRDYIKRAIPEAASALGGSGGFSRQVRLSRGPWVGL